MDQVACAPNLNFETSGCRPTDRSSRWTTAWRVANLGHYTALILAAWLPHDQFMGENQEFQPPLEVPLLGCIDLEVTVECAEAPDTIIENAFVILRLAYCGREWRVYARQQVCLDSRGVPHANCQSVTCNPVGGSDSGGSGLI